jgi:uncharacterized membrane protein YphA (DoxX/SURF4 family)
MKYFLWLIRIVVGVLFIFSGLVKANDPLGLSYKMDEFFEVWNMHWMSPYSLTLSVIMIAFEIIAGIAVITGYAYRVFSFLLLLLILFFTFLTAYVLFSGKIKECGCFGDCIKISNEETFYKDVALTVLAVILFIFRNRIQPLFNRPIGTAIMILTAFFAFGIQWWTLEHLPFYDCLPYKVGADIKVDKNIPPGAIPDQYETMMVYKNKKTGELKDFTTQNFPWQDTINWEYADTKSKLIKKGNAEPKIKDFMIRDQDGGEHTDEILNAPGYTFLLFVNNVDKARKDNLDKLKKLIAESQQQGMAFYILCSADKDKTAKFIKDWGFTGVDVLVFDYTASKTALRSNPGLLLLEQGVIKGKWSFRDYPEVKDGKVVTK